MLATRLFAPIRVHFPLPQCLTMATLMILPGPEPTPAGTPLTSPAAYVGLKATANLSV